MTLNTSATRRAAAAGSARQIQRALASFAAILAWLGPIGQAVAQQGGWPSKTARIVAPFPPGGSIR